MFYRNSRQASISLISLEKYYQIPEQKLRVCFSHREKKNPKNYTAQQNIFVFNKKTHTKKNFGKLSFPPAKIMHVIFKNRNRRKSFIFHSTTKNSYFISLHDVPLQFLVTIRGSSMTFFLIK